MKKKKISATVLMMLGLMAFAILMGLVERKTLSSIYDESMQEFNRGNYKSALELMESIPDADAYRDLSERIQEVRKYIAYEDANIQYTEGNKLEALKAFIDLGDFKDSESKVKDIIMDYARDLENGDKQP